MMTLLYNLKDAPYFDFANISSHNTNPFTPTQSIARFPQFTSKDGPKTLHFIGWRIHSLFFNNIKGVTSSDLVGFIITVQISVLQYL